MPCCRSKQAFFILCLACLVMTLVVHLALPDLYYNIRETLLEYTYMYEDDQFPISKDVPCDGKWQAWYKEFHAKSLQTNGAKNRKYLIFYCPGHNAGCGGYGNRMIGMVSVFYLSIILKRTFMLYWGGPEVLEEFLLPNEIDWTYDAAKLEGLKTRTNYWGAYLPGGYDRSKRQSEENFKTWVKKVDFEREFDAPVEKLNTIWYFAELLWSNSWLKQRARELQLPGFDGSHPYSMIGCAMGFLFKKSRLLMKEFDKVKPLLTSRNRPYLGIHLRTSDHHWGSTNRHSYRTSVPRRVFLCAQRVEKAIKKKRVSLRDKTFTWFLATDDVKMKEMAARDYGSQVVTLNIIPRHLDTSESGYQEILRELLLDQLMLLECDYFLPTRDSTFSYIVIGMRFVAFKNFAFGERCPLNEKTVALATPLIAKNRTLG